MKLLKDKLVLDKTLTKLDKAVLEFAKALEPLKYVIVSGYVSILLGRSRGTEDVDFVLERLSADEFEHLSKKLAKAGYWCINPGDASELYNGLLAEGSAIRFAEKDTVIPNFEVRLAKDEVDGQALAKRLRVETAEGVIFISPIEMQIAYKRHVLGSDKDIEDALHLEEVFKGQLDKIKLEKWSEGMKSYAKRHY